MEKMKNEFLVKQKELEKIIKSNNMTDEQKKALLTGIEFGYASAFCQMAIYTPRESQKYRDAYDNFRKKLE